MNAKFECKKNQYVNIICMSCLPVCMCQCMFVSTRSRYILCFIPYCIVAFCTVPVSIVLYNG